MEIIGGNYSTFTLLREPIERTLSFLRHQKVFHAELRELTLEELYSDTERFETLIRNHMVKMLSLDADAAYPGGLISTAPIGPDHLDIARDRLDRIDVVGVIEDMAGFVRRLEARFGWDLGPIEVSNRTEPEAVSEEFRERIATDNALDVELYAYATEQITGSAEGTLPG